MQTINGTVRHVCYAFQQAKQGSDFSSIDAAMVTAYTLNGCAINKG
jgi:hypothetical protein